MMKSASVVAACVLIAVQVPATPAQALGDNEKAALAAAAVLGIAALAHNNNHYVDGYKPNDSKALARFERGYRDGLHNEPYDAKHGGSNYAHGYDAGQKERHNRLAHKTRNIKGTKVPTAAMQGCRTEAASSWGVGKRDVHVVNAGQEGADNFYIEFAAGHRHVICGTNSKGKVFNLRNGRL